MERQIHRLEKRRHSHVLAIGIVAAIALFLSVTKGPALFKAAFDVLKSQVFARISGLMRLENIEWEESGETNLSSKVTKEALLGSSQLKLGQEMLSIKLEDLEEKLLKLPWLESAQIQKKFPSTIVVRYTVHQACALGLKNNKLWLVSTTGKYVAPMPEKDKALFDLPVLGREESSLAELAWLDVLSKNLQPHLLSIHQVDVSRHGERMAALVELGYSSRSFKVNVIANGAPQQSDAMGRLRQVVQYLIKNNILASTIDLRAGKKVVVNIGKRS